MKKCYESNFILKDELQLNAINEKKKDESKE